MAESIKPLFIAHSRNITKDEVENFNRLYDTVIVVNENTNKDVISHNNTCVFLCDIRKTRCRDYLSRQTKFFTPNDNLILLKHPSDTIIEPNIYNFVCKRLNVPMHGYQTKAELLNHLKVKHTCHQVETRKSKFLKKAFRCFFK